MSNLDDELSRRLRDDLRAEADLVATPNRFDEIRAAGRLESQRRSWLAPVAAAMLLVVLGGGFMMNQLMSGGASTVTAGTADRQSQDKAGAAAPEARPSVFAAPTSPGSAGASTPTATKAGGNRDVSAPIIGFASPSGNIVCIMNRGGGSGGVECALQVAPTWNNTLTCEGVGGPGKYVYDAGVVGIAQGKAQLACQSQEYGSDEFSTGASTATTGWAVRGEDTFIRLGGGGTAYEVPVLPYGGSARTADTECMSAETGVTCRDLRTGSSFTVSLQAVTLT